jgi:ketosteroid isomerase-like protein
MYSFFVRKFVRQVFQSLNEGDYETVLKGVSPTITHTFSGSHALGGTRHSIEAMRQWFQRLYRLSPGLNFDIKNIAVSGAPWDTTIAVEWVDSATPADGSDYVNEGVHAIKMRWGKAVYIHAYLDTQKVEAMCDRLVKAGFAEAAALPIED